MTDEQVMELALDQARAAELAGEVPVGAVALFENRVVAAEHNSPISSSDPTAHAEVNALRAAARHLGAYRIEGVDIFVTLEPCLMCFGAMLHARVRRLVYGAPDPKVGFSRIFDRLPPEATLNHAIQIRSGVLEAECSRLLLQFFRQRR